MAKASVPRKRYVVFELRASGAEMDEEKLKQAISAEALKFFGEFGLSSVALKLMSYDRKTKRGVLRCARDQMDNVLGFLALVSTVGGVPTRLVALKSSGTLKSLESTLASTHAA